MRLAIFVISFSFLSLTATQVTEPSVRELPAWLVNTYHYGVSPVTTAFALLARAGWFTAKGAWWTTKSLAQGAWNTGKFTYNNPVTGCALISTNLFIAYMLYKAAQEQYHESEVEFNDWLQDWRLGQEYQDIL